MARQPATPTNATASDIFDKALIDMGPLQTKANIGGEKHSAIRRAICQIARRAQALLISRLRFWRHHSLIFAKIHLFHRKVSVIKMAAPSLERIVSLCKRRGFIFADSEIYGGIASTWDYGPLGIELKNNVTRAWWHSVVYERDDMEGLDAAILMNRLVWRYSGHEATFSDPMTDCRNCKARPRADHVFVAQKGRDPKGLVEINAALAAKELKCPKCGSTDLTEARPF